VINSKVEEINLKGFIVGNGVTNWHVDTNPVVPETLFWMNVIPTKLMNEFQANDCNFYGNGVFKPDVPTKTCYELWARMQQLLIHLDPYDLFRQVYHDPNSSAHLESEQGRLGTSMVEGELKTYRKGMTRAEYTPWANNELVTESKHRLGDYTSDYMNLEEVRNALHIPAEVQAWEECSNKLDYRIFQEGSEWIYKILRGKYRMFFYSGDTDSVVATYGSKLWIKGLGWESTEAWRPWFTEGQVSGYVEKYDGLDFATVKGVGHMAPQWARQPVENMITSWIHGEDF